MLFYAHDNESGRVWLIGADSEEDAVQRAGISTWMLRPIGASFKGVITFNPEPWEPDTVQSTPETSLTPAEEESLRERSDLMHKPAEY